MARQPMDSSIPQSAASATITEATDKKKHAVVDEEEEEEDGQAQGSLGKEILKIHSKRPSLRGAVVGDGASAPPLLLSDGSGFMSDVSSNSNCDDESESESSMSASASDFDLLVAPAVRPPKGKSKKSKRRRKSSATATTGADSNNNVEVAKRKSNTAASSTIGIVTDGGSKDDNSAGRRKRTPKEEKNPTETRSSRPVQEQAPPPITQSTTAATTKKKKRKKRSQATSATSGDGDESSSNNINLIDDESSSNNCLDTSEKQLNARKNNVGLLVEDVFSDNWSVTDAGGATNTKKNTTSSSKGTVVKRKSKTKGKGSSSSQIQEESSKTMLSSSKVIVKAADKKKSVVDTDAAAVDKPHPDSPKPKKSISNKKRAAATTAPSKSTMDSSSIQKRDTLMEKCTTTNSEPAARPEAYGAVDQPQKTLSTKVRSSSKSKNMSVNQVDNNKNVLFVGESQPRQGDAGATATKRPASINKSSGKAGAKSSSSSQKASFTSSKRGAVSETTVENEKGKTSELGGDNALNDSLSLEDLSFLHDATTVPQENTTKTTNKMNENKTKGTKKGMKTEDFMESRSRSFSSFQKDVASELAKVSAPVASTSSERRKARAAMTAMLNNSSPDMHSSYSTFSTFKTFKTTPAAFYKNHNSTSDLSFRTSRSCSPCPRSRRRSRPRRQASSSGPRRQRRNTIDNAEKPLFLNHPELQRMSASAPAHDSIRARRKSPGTAGRRRPAPRRMKSHDAPIMPPDQRATRSMPRRTKSAGGDPDESLIRPRSRSRSQNRRPPKTSATIPSSSRTPRERSQSLNLARLNNASSSSIIYRHPGRLRKAHQPGETSPGGNTRASLGMDYSVQSLPANVARRGSTAAATERRVSAGPQSLMPPKRSKSSDSSTNVHNNSSSCRGNIKGASTASGGKKIRRTSSRDSTMSSSSKSRPVRRKNSGASNRRPSDTKARKATNNDNSDANTTRALAAASASAVNGAPEDLDEDETIHSTASVGNSCFAVAPSTESLLSGDIATDSFGQNNLPLLKPVLSAEKRQVDVISHFSMRSGQTKSFAGDDASVRSEASTIFSGSSYAAPSVASNSAATIASKKSAASKGLPSGQAKPVSSAPNTAIGSYFGSQHTNPKDVFARGSVKSANESVATSSVAGSLLSDYSKNSSNLEESLSNLPSKVISPFSEHAGAPLSAHTRKTLGLTEHTTTPLIPDSDDEETCSFHLDDQPVQQLSRVDGSPAAPNLPKKKQGPGAEKPKQAPAIAKPKTAVKKQTTAVAIAADNKNKKPVPTKKKTSASVLAEKGPGTKKKAPALKSKPPPAASSKPAEQKAPKAAPSSKKPVVEDLDDEFQDPRPYKSDPPKGRKPSFWDMLCCRSADAILPS